MRAAGGVRVARRLVRLTATLVLLWAMAGSAAEQPGLGTDLARRLDEASQLLESGRAADARVALEAVLADARTQGDQATTGHALGQLGRALQLLGDPSGADARFAEAETVLTRVGDPYPLGLLLNARAQFLYARGDMVAAEAGWRRALELFETAGQPRDQARVLYSLTFVRRQDTNVVVALLERGLSLARTAGARDVEGLILQRWSDEHVLQGEYGAALEKIRAAVTVLEQVGKPAQVARALTSLGRVYRLHGSYDEALAAFERALALHRETSDVAGIGQSMNAVAVALRVLGRTAGAVAAARAATGFLQERQDRSGTLALAFHTLATALEDSGRKDDALAAVEQGLTANPTAADRPLLLSTRASLLSALGRGEVAMAVLADANALATDRRDIKGMRLGTRVELLARAGRTAEALEASAALLRLYEEERSRSAPVDGLKAGFDNVRQWAWAQRVRLLAEAGRPGEALEATEGARARAFADLLAARRLDDGGTSVSSSVAGPVAAPPHLSEMAAHAARLDSTVVSYWVERDVVRIWVVDRDARVRHAVSRVDQRRLGQLVRATWSRADSRAQAATTNGSVPTPVVNSAGRALRELHALLVSPIAHALPRGLHRRLTIVPHGPLFRLSFAALRSPSGRYLLEDFDIHYTPSMGVLTATEVMTRHAVASGTLVVAAPSLGRALRADGLPPLPAAAAEGRAVAALAGVSRATVLNGPRATEIEVRRLSPGRRVLHFATHAVVSDDHPLDSYLALAADTTGGAGDGRFTAEDVYGLRLDADLVVLSACRTAGGRVTGDGISGLVRAFVYAGTPSVVATLWDLPDVAGAFALPRFYRARTGGAGKAAALRSAQLALLQELRAGRVTVDTPAGRFVLPEHPTFWAGLVLIGEP